MALIPLQQWVCDYCGEVINSPDEGYLEWKKDDDGFFHGFKIVHHYPSSPLKDKRIRKGCYHYNDYDLSLNEIIGDQGLVMLLSFLDIGNYHAPDNPISKIRDFREYTELFKRLLLPYYEEARRYWNTAIEDNFFDSANEIWIYLPENLKTLIDNYSN
ncbi:MAG: hypothetical protein HQ591_08970 [candidate division Zixibacteria bacterium]|nr:hypothetical protein [Candidatus Tariuqbacter arcticus]